MAPLETDAVRVYKGLVDHLLHRAVQTKPEGRIEPPLTETLLGKNIWKVSEVEGEHEAVQQLNQQTRLAAVEIAFREKFYRILVSMLLPTGRGFSGIQLTGSISLLL